MPSETASYQSLARLATLDGAPSGSAGLSAARLGKSTLLTEDLAHDRPSAPRDPCPVIRFRQNRTDRIRPRALGAWRRARLHRRYRQSYRRGGIEGQGRL